MPSAIVVGRARAREPAARAQLARRASTSQLQPASSRFAQRAAPALSGDELAPLAVEAELGAAAQAGGVLEEDELSAGGAGEGAHGRARVARAATSAAAPTA